MGTWQSLSNVHVTRIQGYKIILFLNGWTEKNQKLKSQSHNDSSKNEKIRITE